MRHKTTDPACINHRPPRGWFSWWRFNRGRGKRCQVCDDIAERIIAATRNRR